MYPSLIEIGSKTAEKNSAQTNRQTDKQTDRRTDRQTLRKNGHLAVNQYNKYLLVITVSYCYNYRGFRLNIFNMLKFKFYYSMQLNSDNKHLIVLSVFQYKYWLIWQRIFIMWTASMAADDS